MHSTNCGCDCVCVPFQFPRRRRAFRGDGVPGGWLPNRCCDGDVHGRGSDRRRLQRGRIPFRQPRLQKLHNLIRTSVKASVSQYRAQQVQLVKHSQCHISGPTFSNRSKSA